MLLSPSLLHSTDFMLRGIIVVIRLERASGSLGSKGCSRQTDKTLMIYNETLIEIYMRLLAGLEQLQLSRPATGSDQPTAHCVCR